MPNHTATDRADHIETIDEVITTETKFGPIGRAFNAVKNNPFKSVLAFGATAGAGYVAYTQIRDHGSPEEVSKTVEHAAAAFRSLLG